MTPIDETPRRVVVVHGGGGMGGSERWLLDVLAATSTLRLDVVLLARGPFAGELLARGIPTQQWPTQRNPLSLARTVRRLAKLVRRQRAEIVVANGVKAAVLALGAAKLARVPVIWVKHDHAYDGRIGTMLARRMRAVTGTSVELVAAVGYPDAQVLQPPRPSKASASPDAARAFWRRNGLELGDQPAVAFVGRLVPSKGVDVAIRALARPGGRPWILVVIGPEDEAAPGERVRLEGIARAAGVETRVRFVGSVADAGHWLAAFDAVVVPTTSDERVAGEGFGLVVLESLLAGVPVIASRGIPALRLADGAAIAIPPGDDGELGVALGDISNRTEQARSCARRLQQSYPDVASVARDFVEVVDRAIRAGS